MWENLIHLLWLEQALIQFQLMQSFYCILYNLTSILFTQRELDIRILGWHFKIQSKKMSQLQTKCQFENLHEQPNDLAPASFDSEGQLGTKLVDISDLYLAAPVR